MSSVEIRGRFASLALKLSDRSDLHSAAAEKSKASGAIEYAISELVIAKTLMDVALAIQEMLKEA